MDYDIEIGDTNPTAVATFKNTGTGMLSAGGDQPSPVNHIPIAACAYTLTGLTNYQRYTVTVSAIGGSTRLMSESVTLVPSNLRVYLGLMRYEIRKEQL